MVVQELGEPDDLGLAKAVTAQEPSSAFVGMVVVQDRYLRAKPKNRAMHVRKTRKGFSFVL